MRAWEFITEGKKVPDSPEHHDGPMTGLHRFADSTWASRFNIAHPYTKEEADKLKLAYKAAGVKKFDDITKGDLSSTEPTGHNDTSPIKPFKGYKR